MGDPKLFEEFSKVSAYEWKEKILTELKGANFDETMIWESPEGIRVRPFYTSEDLKGIQYFSTGKKGPWKICQSIYVKDANQANSEALDAISRGAESISFTIPSGNITKEILLRGIDVETLPLYFDLRFLDPSYLENNKGKIKNAYFNLDCIGHLARTGNWFSDAEIDFKTLRNLQEGGLEKIISVDLSLYQNAGADIVQQLAYSLAHANAYFGGELVRDAITFKVSIGTNYFFEIAKLRALRWLYATLAEEYGLPAACHIVAEPTKRNKTLYDYNSNLLRTTTECMAAILGGADTVCNLAYDSIYHRSNEFGTRIARNQLLILQHESYFAEVVNPVDGTYYIETLTLELAEKGLQMFKKIEAKGGFLKLLQEGTIQKEIAQSARVEQEKFDVGDLVLVGANAYQSHDDRMKDTMEFNPFHEKGTGRTFIEPITERRLASNLEKNRMGDE